MCKVAHSCAPSTPLRALCQHRPGGEAAHAVGHEVSLLVTSEPPSSNPRSSIENKAPSTTQALPHRPVNPRRFLSPHARLKHFGLH